MAYTTIDDASLYFRVKTYTGNSTNNTAITWDETHANMQPDWLWLKQRTVSSQEHFLADIVRGADKFLESDTTNAEADSTSGFDSFDTNGFTVDDSARSNRGTMVGWGWKAGGSASSNSNGSITSSVSVSTDAGFSIVSYTGNGTQGATIGHGLGIKPSWILVKRRDNTSDWLNYHSSLGATKSIFLNATHASGTYNYWNSTEPTSSVFEIFSSTSAAINASGGTYIAYCFAEKKGYSKFGSWTGNGNADGPFIFTGFLPSFIIGKNTSRSEDWFMLDNKRDTFNPVDQRLQPNSSGTESTVTSLGIDFCANGFKLRGATNQYNPSGETMIYMAFAESPFVNSNGVPTNSR